MGIFIVYSMGSIAFAVGSIRTLMVEPRGSWHRTTAGIYLVGSVMFLMGSIGSMVATAIS